MNKKLDEDIILDEHQKDNEPISDNKNKEKAKRIVLAVILLILALCCVVLGIFCATGLFDSISTPAVALASYVYDDNFNYFNINARNFVIWGQSDSVTPDFNAFMFAGSDTFYTWLINCDIPSCTNESVFTFYNSNSNTRVADLLLTYDGQSNGSIYLRMFADNKQTSYSRYELLRFVLLDNDVNFVNFTNTYCFGYDTDSCVYGKMSDGMDETWACEFTELLWLCCDVSHLGSADCQLSYVPLTINDNGGTYGSRCVFEWDKDNYIFWIYKTKSIIDDTTVIDDIVVSPQYFDSFPEFSFEGFYKWYAGTTFNKNSTAYKDGYNYYALIVPIGWNNDAPVVVCTDVYMSDDFYAMCGIGEEQGYTKALNDTDIVTNGIIDVIESPIDLLKTVFNFEIFGINISSVIFFIISIVIVAFVIKKVV